MLRIKDWTARRAGAGITVSGYGADSVHLRITHVEMINVTPDGVFAIDKRGRQYVLDAAAQPAGA